MKITSNSLPEEFSIKDCKTNYNIKSLEKPNTVLTCKLTGESSEAIIQNITFITSAKGYAIQIETELTLSILDELPE